MFEVKKMVGRKKEIQVLKNAYESDKAELVAIYGRRRIGKTYLVYETFNDVLSFSHAGLSPLDIEKKTNKEQIAEQLKHFRNSLKLYGLSDCPELNDWSEAFFELERLLTSKRGHGPLVVFIDELPWLDTPKSDFVKAFEGFWNTWACRFKDVKVFVCGSAASWMLNRLINDKGGLYGRVTREIPMKPFTLKETEELFLSKGIRLSRYDIIRAYMVFGGIPYYLNYFEKGKTVSQTVNDLLFGPNAVLRREFSSLFTAIFDQPKKAEMIVRALSSKNRGLERKELIAKTGIKDGGALSSILNALEYSSLILRYNLFGHSKKEVYYKLVDPFCLFYLHFVEDASTIDPSFWQGVSQSQTVVSWRGFAFENVCFTHINEIKKSLGIAGVNASISPFYSTGEEGKGSQIDLLISRADNFVNLCEIKFYGNEYTQNRKESLNLSNKVESIVPLIPKKASVHPVLITTFGLKYNEYSGDYEHIVTADDLFA